MNGENTLYLYSKYIFFNFRSKECFELTYKNKIILEIKDLHRIIIIFVCKDICKTAL